MMEVSTEKNECEELLCKWYREIPDAKKEKYMELIKVISAMIAGKEL